MEVFAFLKKIRMLTIIQKETAVYDLLTGG